LPQFEPYGTEPQTSPLSRPPIEITLPRERFSPSTLSGSICVPEAVIETGDSGPSRPLAIGREHDRRQPRGRRQLKSTEAQPRAVGCGRSACLHAPATQVPDYPPPVCNTAPGLRPPSAPEPESAAVRERMARLKMHKGFEMKWGLSLWHDRERCERGRRTGSSGPRANFRAHEGQPV